jgi:hypothetical protein
MRNAPLFAGFASRTLRFMSNLPAGAEASRHIAIAGPRQRIAKTGHRFAAVRHADAVAWAASRARQRLAVVRAANPVAGRASEANARPRAIARVGANRCAARRQVPHYRRRRVGDRRDGWCRRGGHRRDGRGGSGKVGEYAQDDQRHAEISSVHDASSYRVSRNVVIFGKSVATRQGIPYLAENSIRRDSSV